eukprot:TRINITY_DN2617_c0_g1_i1.p1 TRINITY_DN2617_c0_g1~~TRINITY_DN2617_c0_g1_i1.p1  ORF type:complete len:509 (-),score=159.32 TRINITY_DN2617_c0_g1_i1:1621-3147(-)
MVSSGPGMVSSGPGRVSSGPGMVSSGPGRAGMVSSGPGMVSSGPGRAGMVSSGPGMVSSGPGRVSSGPGMMNAGRGNMVSSGPGVKLSISAQAVQPSLPEDPNLQAMDDLLSKLGIEAPSIPEDAEVGEDGEIKTTPMTSFGPGKGAKQIQPAAAAPDGSDVEFSGPPCHSCSRPIIGKFFSAAGKQFHPECFVCNVCNIQITEDTGFVEGEDGTIYCEKDFNDKFAPKCETCKKPVTDACIKIGDKLYHPDHFVCNGCGCKLRGKPYREIDGLPYCPPCKELRVKAAASKGELCAKCKQPIVGDYLIINGQKMHPDHFRCEICHADFLGGNFKEHEGKSYCNNCFDKISQSNCHRCQKPITSRSITALNHIFHPECFTCTVCHDPFPAGSFFEKDGEPYCKFHYNKLFGKVCIKCEGLIPGEAIEFGGRHYHPACFGCHGCSKPFSSSSKVTNVEGKPMCNDCFGKLPKEVRKRILDRLEAEQKAKKAQEKAEKAEQKAIEKAEKAK